MAITISITIKSKQRVLCQETLINSFIGRGNGSKLSLVRRTLKFDRYLSTLLVELPSNEDDLDILKWWKQIESLMYPVVFCITRNLPTIQISTITSKSAFIIRSQIVDYHMSSFNIEGAGTYMP